jgi:hypothetical protein
VLERDVAAALTGHDHIVPANSQRQR